MKNTPWTFDENDFHIRDNAGNTIALVKIGVAGFDLLDLIATGQSARQPGSPTPAERPGYSGVPQPGAPTEPAGGRRSRLGHTNDVGRDDNRAGLTAFGACVFGLSALLILLSLLSYV